MVLLLSIFAIPFQNVLFRHLVFWRTFHCFDQSNEVFENTIALTPLDAWFKDQEHEGGNALIPIFERW